MFFIPGLTILALLSLHALDLMASQTGKETFPNRMIESVPLNKPTYAGDQEKSLKSVAYNFNEANIISK